MTGKRVPAHRLAHRKCSERQVQSPCPRPCLPPTRKREPPWALLCPPRPLDRPQVLRRAPPARPRQPRVSSRTSRRADLASRPGSTGKAGSRPRPPTRPRSQNYNGLGDRNRRGQPRDPATLPMRAPRRKEAHASNVRVTCA